MSLCRGQITQPMPAASTDPLCIVYFSWWFEEGCVKGNTYQLLLQSRLASQSVSQLTGKASSPTAAQKLPTWLADCPNRRCRLSHSFVVVASDDVASNGSFFLPLSFRLLGRHLPLLILLPPYQPVKTVKHLLLEQAPQWDQSQTHYGVQLTSGQTKKVSRTNLAVQPRRQQWPESSSSSFSIFTASNVLIIIISGRRGRASKVDLLSLSSSRCSCLDLVQLTAAGMSTLLLF
jgi:hypothetical protein